MSQDSFTGQDVLQITFQFLILSAWWAKFQEFIKIQSNPIQPNMKCTFNDDSSLHGAAAVVHPYRNVNHVKADVNMHLQLKGNSEPCFKTVSRLIVLVSPSKQHQHPHGAVYFPLT